MPTRLLRRKQVEEVVGLSRSEIYRLVGLGRFPAPVPLGARAVAWVADEVEAWIDELIAKRAQDKAQAHTPLASSRRLIVNGLK